MKRAHAGDTGEASSGVGTGGSGGGDGGGAAAAAAAGQASLASEMDRWEAEEAKKEQQQQQQQRQRRQQQQGLQQGQLQQQRRQPPRGSRAAQALWESMTEEQKTRFEFYRRSFFPKPLIRGMLNSALGLARNAAAKETMTALWQQQQREQLAQRLQLSHSKMQEINKAAATPTNDDVIIVVSAMLKMFVGSVVDRARQAMLEEIDAVEADRKRMRTTAPPQTFASAGAAAATAAAAAGETGSGQGGSNDNSNNNDDNGERDSDTETAAQARARQLPLNRSTTNIAPHHIFEALRRMQDAGHLPQTPFPTGSRLLHGPMRLPR